MTTPRVAVIGGGLAGLAAAARLRALGLEPRVLESGPEVGGALRTWQRDGWIIDNGACAAAEPDESVRQLLDTAGLADCTVRAGPDVATRYIVHDGVPVPLPRTTAEFTSSPLLSLAGRLRLLKERFIPAQRDVPDESVDSFARRRFGDEVADRMFDPLVASTCAGDPSLILARFAFPTVVGHEHRAGSGLQGSLRARMEARRRAKGRPSGNWSCAAGMQQLPRRLASWIGGVRTGAPVTAVRSRGGAFDVVIGGNDSESFDAVVIAVPAHALGRIAIDVSEAHRLADVAAIPHTSIVTVSLGFRRDRVSHSLDGWRLLVPTVERRSLLSVVFPSSAFPDRAPPDHVLLTAFVGGARRPDLIDATDGDVAALVARELAELLGTSGPPVICRITRWRDALPQAIAGHARRLAAADIVEAAAPGLAFAGAWRDGLSVAEVLRGGMYAADRLAVRRGWRGVSSTT
jgi:oxygen-dependent protoporphyrinogen oxidase